jgi:hypothetical protein
VHLEINGKIFDVSSSDSVYGRRARRGAHRGGEGSLADFCRSGDVAVPDGDEGRYAFKGLAQLGAYLSEAPAGYVHRRVVNGQVLPEGVAAAPTNTTRVCLTKGKSYQVSYTVLTSAKPSCSSATVCQTQSALGFVTGTVSTSKGTACAVTKPVVAGANWGGSVCSTGDYGCMGQCGPGCLNLFGTRIMLDCLRHDTCSHDKVASGQSADTSCGDEYTDASDDANHAGDSSDATACTSKL